MNNLYKISCNLSPVLLILLFVLGNTGLAKQLQAQIVSQMPTFPLDRTVVEMTSGELLQYYPDLTNVEPTPNQDLLDSILKQTGKGIQEFLQNFANTSSKELLVMQTLRYSGAINQSDSREFNYLMFYHPSGDKPLLEEYRADKNGQPITQEAVTGFFVTSGYLGLSLNFHPIYQKGLRFRYLGQESKRSRAHRIAFAQKPEIKDLMISYIDTNTGKATRLPIQGICWIDPNTYRILRLQINLQPSGNQSSITSQSTNIQFGEARFKDSQTTFWLPREVVVMTTFAGRLFRTYHRYSDYLLFAVNSDSKVEKPKAK